MESFRSAHGLERGGRGEEGKQRKKPSGSEIRRQGGGRRVRLKEIEKSDKASYAHSSGSDSIVGIRFARNRYRIYAFVSKRLIRITGPSSGSD